ncbi:MAG: hypothetical protein U0694_00440 [Anaerolineae bacterium]
MVKQICWPTATVLALSAPPPKAWLVVVVRGERADDHSVRQGAGVIAVAGLSAVSVVDRTHIDAHVVVADGAERRTGEGRASDDAIACAGRCA